MSKKDEKILEQSYTIEALEDEIRHLDEENDRLTNNILDKIEVIKEYDNDNKRLHETVRDNDDLVKGLRREIEGLDEYIGLLLTPSEPKKVKKTRREPKYAADIALDFWPPSDWVRFSLSKFRPGRYFQVCIGPLRMEFYAA